MRGNHQTVQAFGTPGCLNGFGHGDGGFADGKHVGLTRRARRQMLCKDAAGVGRRNRGVKGVAKVLAGLGFQPEDYERPCRAVSWSGIGASGAPQAALLDLQAKCQVET